MDSHHDSRMAPLLKAEGIFKHYRLGGKRIEVLHGVDFELQAQGFVAIHGASGAGKSTLLHVLGGLDSPDSGELWFGNRSYRMLTGKSLAHFRNREIGFVFQAYHLFPEFSALENVCLPGKIARRPTDELRQIGFGLLDAVGVKDRSDHRPYELSGGEQQRVGIARALINQPSLILADEPTGNLDSVTGREITTLLETLRAERSFAMVLATHDQSIGERADRVVHLVDGRIRED